jgi:hypothetical protein
MTPLCKMEVTLPGVFRGVSRMTVRLISDGELLRLEALRDLDQRRLTTEATRLLGVIWSGAYETSILRRSSRLGAGEFARRSVRGVARG